MFRYLVLNPLKNRIKKKKNALFQKQPPKSYGTFLEVHRTKKIKSKQPLPADLIPEIYEYMQDKENFNPKAIKEWSSTLINLKLTNRRNFVLAESPVFFHSEEKQKEILDKITHDFDYALGPELALSKKKHTSKILFPTFEDRIPSKKNPAYPEYCKMVGIDPSEKDPLILISTIGQKGPSSFIFSPAFEENISSEDIVNFRKKLNLTIREFSELFDFSVSTIFRIENNLTLGKDALKRLELYIKFPEVAWHEVKKNVHKINEEKSKFVEKFLRVHKKSYS